MCEGCGGAAWVRLSGWQRYLQALQTKLTANKVASSWLDCLRAFVPEPPHFSSIVPHSIALLHLITQAWIYSSFISYKFACCGMFFGRKKWQRPERTGHGTVSTCALCIVWWCYSIVVECFMSHICKMQPPTPQLCSTLLRPGPLSGSLYLFLINIYKLICKALSALWTDVLKRAFLFIHSSFIHLTHIPIHVCLHSQVPPHHIKTYQIEKQENSTLESVTSAIHFMVTTQHFLKGQMRVSRTDILNLYKSSGCTCQGANIFEALIYESIFICLAVVSRMN